MIDRRRKPYCPKCGLILFGIGDVWYCRCGYEQVKTEVDKYRRWKS